MKFSKEQIEAINHVDGPMMVVAGPGSGKTTTIVNRINNLIVSAGVSPADILVLTFTKAAANEMKSRFEKSVDSKVRGKVRFGTFHSIFFWILKVSYNFTSQNIISEADEIKLIKSFTKEVEIDVTKIEDDLANTVLKEISIIKSNLISIDDYYSPNMPENVFRSIYTRLEKEKKRANKIDFDDMLVMAYELLTQRDDILKKVQNIFRYILVDEFQDTNRIQYELLKLIASPRNNVFIVGDDDQSVYGFRGATPMIMQLFEKDYAGTKKIMLTQNFRSASVITKMSSRLIQNNKNRFQKTIVSGRDIDGTVELYFPNNEYDEFVDVVTRIKDNYAKGIPYDKQAIIYRTNQEPKRLVYRLEKNDIPYVIKDSIPNLFNHHVIKDILSYFRLANGDTKREYFLQVMNKPVRYIPRNILVEETIDFDRLYGRLQDKGYVIQNLNELLFYLSRLVKMKPVLGVDYILETVGYESYLKKYSEENETDYLEYIDLIDELKELIRDVDNFDELFGFIEEYSRILEHKKENSTYKKGVNLVTMHSSKGLEYESVFIINAVDGVNPHKRSKTAHELEEERRMFYVAMTRAIRSLIIYSPREIAGKPGEVSPYIKELNKRN